MTTQYSDAQVARQVNRALLSNSEPDLTEVDESDQDSIQNTLVELKNITTKLKSINKEAKHLREQKKDCEGKIIKFLQTKGRQGLKFNQTVFFADEKKRRGYKSKVDKMLAGVQVLEKAGVQNPKEVLESVLEAQKGTAKTTVQLKVKEDTGTVFDL